MKILSQADIKSIITMRDAIDAMIDAFRAVSENTITMPLRTPIKLTQHDALSLYMPAYIENSNQLGIKIASVYPHNHEKNIPAINGVIALLNAETGQVKAVLDAEYLTALRTGAASGLATELFAHKEATHLAILGSGAQAHTQLEAIACVRPITDVSIWSRSRDNAEKFAEQYKNEFTFHLHDTPRDACINADVVCTVTSSTSPLITQSDVPAHCHINGVGSHTPHHAEISEDLLVEATIYVDQKSAVMAESGEIINAVNAKAIAIDDLIEIGACVSSDNAKQQNSLTVFKSVGLAVQDIAVAEKVLTLATNNSIGNDIEIN